MSVDLSYTLTRLFVCTYTQTVLYRVSKCVSVCVLVVVPIVGDVQKLSKTKFHLYSLYVDVDVYRGDFFFKCKDLMRQLGVVCACANFSFTLSIFVILCLRFFLSLKLECTNTGSS